MPVQLWRASLEFPTGTQEVFYPEQDFTSLGKDIRTFCARKGAICMDIIPIPQNPELEAPPIRTLIKGLKVRGHNPFALKAGDQVQIYDLAMVLIEIPEDEDAS